MNQVSFGREFPLHRILNEFAQSGHNLNEKSFESNPQSESYLEDSLKEAALILRKSVKSNSKYDGTQGDSLKDDSFAGEKP